MSDSITNPETPIIVIVNKREYINKVITDSVIEKLQDENLKLKKCVEFYADSKNWQWLNQFSGQRARQTLAEIKENER